MLFLKTESGVSEQLPSEVIDTTLKYIRIKTELTVEKLKSEYSVPKSEFDTIRAISQHTEATSTPNQSNTSFITTSEHSNSSDSESNNSLDELIRSFEMVPPVNAGITTLSEFLKLGSQILIRPYSNKVTRSFNTSVTFKCHFDFHCIRPFSLIHTFERITSVSITKKIVEELYLSKQY